MRHRIIWIVIGKMFINQSFTENKAVINGKTVQIFSSISQPRFTPKGGGGGGHSKKFGQGCSCYLLGLKFDNLLFFWVAQNEGDFFWGGG